MSPRLNIASYIDQSLLHASASRTDIEHQCLRAEKYGFKCLVVNPVWVKTAAERIKRNDVKIGSVCGFPLGATTAELKAHEAGTVENEGASEIDMVINIGAAKSGDFKLIERELLDIRRALAADTVLKAIIECALLDEVEIVTCSKIAVECGADFVKSSTGFAGDVTVSQIELLFKAVEGKIGVKAAGGIRDLRTTISMIEAGASRIGTSAGDRIVEEYLNSINGD
jgi:deoxyribose-phosphate aldolase